MTLYLSIAMRLLGRGWSYLMRIFDALSQLANVIIYPGAEANHSISGDAYRFERDRTRAVIDFVFSPFERDHCRKAFEQEVARARRLINSVDYGA